MLQYIPARILQEFDTIERCGRGGAHHESSEPLSFNIQLNTNLSPNI